MKSTWRLDSGFQVRLLLVAAYASSLCVLYGHICMCVLASVHIHKQEGVLLYSHMQYHNDTIIKTQEDFFINICTSHFIGRVRKGLLKVCVWEGVGDRTELQYFDPHSYGRQRCVFLILQGCSTGSPGAQLSAGWWLSWLNLISNLSPTGLVPKLHQGSRGPFRPLLSLPHLFYKSVRSPTATVWLLSLLSYIIVQRPLSRLLDLWNRVCDRHQAEITVMQFTCHSLPVHQSMSVPWEFFTSSHFISQFPPTRIPLITAIRMCHFLPVHHLGMAFLAGSKAKIQQYFIETSPNNIFTIILQENWFAINQRNQTKSKDISWPIINRDIFNRIL